MSSAGLCRHMYTQVCGPTGTLTSRAPPQEIDLFPFSFLFKIYHKNEVCLKIKVDLDSSNNLIEREDVISH